jgi:hypothetical protein
LTCTSQASDEGIYLTSTDYLWQGENRKKRR